MPFRLRLPNQIDGILCIARRITELTSTKGLSYLLHLTISLSVPEYMENPLKVTCPPKRNPVKMLVNGLVEIEK